MKQELKEGDLVLDFGLDLSQPTTWESIWYKVKFGWRDFIYWWKKQYQKIRYGFPLEESWDFHSTLCKWSLPRLKHLKNNMQGHPMELTSDEWSQVLTDIIWSMENHDATVMPIYPSNYDHHQRVVKYNDFGISFENVDPRPLDWTPVTEHAERVQKGFDLLGKWMLHLWD